MDSFSEVAEFCRKILALQKNTQFKKYKLYLIFMNYADYKSNKNI